MKETTLQVIDETIEAICKEVQGSKKGAEIQIKAIKALAELIAARAAVKN